MTRGVKRKSSASELDLDTLFADLDATVKRATRARTTPTKPVPFSPKHNKSENAWYLADTVKKAERERELLALCDGLGEDIDPTPTKPTRRAPSLHATPLRKREVCCPSAVPCWWSSSHISSSLRSSQHQMVCQRPTSMLLLTVLIGMNSTKRQLPHLVHGRNHVLLVQVEDRL